MTLKELAALVGVTGAQMHRYELASTKISADRLHSIAAALQEPVEALLGGAKPGPAQAARSISELQHDSLELVELFTAIDDQTSRGAILSIVRALVSGSTSRPDQDDPDEASLPDDPPP